VTDIRTCSASLLTPGKCCVDDCGRKAVSAVLTADLVEHARCKAHDVDPQIMARKPLLWDLQWGPLE
jgi:uncharacterized protein (DUF2237 family)